MDSWSGSVRWAVVMGAVAVAYVIGRWVAEEWQRGGFG